MRLSPFERKEPVMGALPAPDNAVYLESVAIEQGGAVRATPDALGVSAAIFFVVEVHHEPPRSNAANLRP
jgi:hypothetical protein